MKIETMSVGVAQYKSTQVSVTKISEDSTQKKEDSISIGSEKMANQDAGLYSPKSLSSADRAKVEELISDSERRMAEFEEMIRSMIAEQSGKYNFIFKGQKLNVSIEESEKAKAAIAPGGEYSVEAVAGRIMDMAKALSGGDPSKAGELKDAVIKGFKEAEKAFGTKLPQISYDTYDEIMKRFDEWEKEGNN